MIRVSMVWVFTVLSIAIFANNPSVHYITQYKQIAIMEMQRTGIPASIKMAQALLESGAGRSTLAQEANNHFGIKCGNAWEGDTFYREDDDYHKGKLVKSCFRKFDSALESFMAHSDFLTNQNRYQFLFDYPVSDYKSWAQGLRKAGYATDRAYAQKLIDIIEKYQLYELDGDNTHIYTEESVIAQSESGLEYGKKRTKDSVADSGTEERTSNGSDYIASSRSYRVNKNAEYHIVRSGETISDIAHVYGIDESGLRLRNRLPKDAEPLEGEKVHLRKKISLLNRPQFERFADEAIASSNADFIF